MPEVIAAARECYAKEALEKIASRKADAIDAARKRAAEAEAGPGAYYRPSNRIDITLLTSSSWVPGGGVENDRRARHAVLRRVRGFGKGNRRRLA